MAILDSLILSLVVRTRNYTGRLRSARRETKRFTSTMGALSRAALRVAAPLAGALAVGRVTSFVSSQASLADQLGKTSDKLGISTEALAGLRLAARRTGVDTRQLDTGLQRAVRRISEAAKGSGEAKDAIKELGLEAKRLNQLTPDQQFSRLAEAFKGVGNQADRVRLAMRLFDTEGVSLVNTLALGADGLEEMQRRARELNLVLSREQVKAIEASKDAWDDLGDSVGGVGRQLSAETAPAMKEASENLRSALGKGSPFRVVAQDAAVLWRDFTAIVAAASETVSFFARENANALHRLLPERLQRRVFGETIAERDLRGFREQDQRDAFRRSLGRDVAGSLNTAASFERAGTLGPAIPVPRPGGGRRRGVTRGPEGERIGALHRDARKRRFESAGLTVPPLRPPPPTDAQLQRMLGVLERIEENTREGGGLN